MWDLVKSELKKEASGLYHGKHIQFGNSISKFGNKSRRTWKPNAHYVYLYSEILDQRIKVLCTAAALVAIDEKGGLDNYILKSKEKYLQSPFAKELKERLLGYPTKKAEERERQLKEKLRIEKLEMQQKKLEQIRQELGTIEPLSWLEEKKIKINRVVPLSIITRPFEKIWSKLQGTKNSTEQLKEGNKSTAA